MASSAFVYELFVSETKHRFPLKSAPFSVFASVENKSIFFSFQIAFSLQQAASCSSEREER